MNENRPLSMRASFIWAFILNRRKNGHKRIDRSAASQAPSISVVIPTLNEAQNLQHVLPKIPGWVSEVLIVDGHSTDNTIEVARQLRPDVRIVMQKRRGKGDALRCGFEAAKGDIIVMLDADGSTDPTEIQTFTRVLMAGADYAKGSRFMQGAGTSDISLFRKLGNLGLLTLVRFFFGGSFSDLCYGYNAFWRDVLPQLNLDGDGFEIETIMNVRALRAGLDIAEVPSFEYDRVYGTSRLRAIPDGWHVLKAILREAWLEFRPALSGAGARQELQPGSLNSASDVVMPADARSA